MAAVVASMSTNISGESLSGWHLAQFTCEQCSRGRGGMLRVHSSARAGSIPESQSPVADVSRCPCSICTCLLKPLCQAPVVSAFEMYRVQEIKRPVHLGVPLHQGDRKMATATKAEGLASSGSLVL